MFNDLLAHLGPGTEFLREAIKDENYDLALEQISSIRTAWNPSTLMIQSLDTLEKEILDLQSGKKSKIDLQETDDNLNP